MKSMNAMARWMHGVAFLLAVTVMVFGATRTPAAPRGSPWNETYFPNVPLVNQDGKTLRFYDDMLKDKVVMINFIFTSCEDACPLETAKLRQVQEQFGDRVGRDVFMYSISITPEHDTPAVLKAYSQKFKVGPGWQFMTGKEEDIMLIRKKLGLVDGNDERPEEHTMSMVVGNEATGVWIKRSSFDNPKVLARVVNDRLFNYAQPMPGRSYGETTHVVAINPGEDLFRRRCQDCHTVGAGDAIGPDLLGVTELRERAWLTRYLQEPNKMLAEKDPIAVSLSAKYKQVPMPNLKLADRDIEQLIEYLQGESRRVTDAKRAEAANHDEHAHHHGHEHKH